MSSMQLPGRGSSIGLAGEEVRTTLSPRRSDPLSEQESTLPAVDREWIASELDKGLAAERTLVSEAKARAESPPASMLSVVYHQLAEAEDRHRSILETIAVRYGIAPSKGPEASIGGIFGWLRGKATDIGASPFDRLTYDLIARATSVLWCTAWVRAFEAIGDAESARDLAVVVAEKKHHLDVLQEGLNRLIEERAKLPGAPGLVAGDAPAAPAAG